MSMFDPQEIKKDFPVFQRLINGKPIIYLDSAASSLKPRLLIDKLNDYYGKYPVNVFRGIYALSEEATAEYEQARGKIAKFIGAQTAEIIFTRNATESINLVAYSWGKAHLKPDDEVVVTMAEHHSNFVTWQQLSASFGYKFKVWNVNKLGQLILTDLDKLITRKTKLLAVTAASNVTGVINNIETIVKTVKKLNKNCLVLVDAAQAVPHMPVDVGKWEADFVVFSGHKMLGPTGIGVLWGKKDILATMPPFNFGGDMIKEVHTENTVFNDAPHRFEAGTPHIAGVIGLGAAIDYLSSLGMDNVRKHGIEITDYALRRLKGIQGISIIGPTDARQKGGVIAFRLKDVHPHDGAQILDDDNICVRVGYHFAQPLHEFLEIGPTVRASFYVYTTKEDIDALVAGLNRVNKVFK